MKKFLVILILMFVLCGCSVNKMNRVKSNFVAAGYTYSQDANKYIEDIIAKANNEDIVFYPHVFILKEGIITNVAVVLEFKSSQKLNEMLKESEMLKGMLKDLKKSDYVYGNCLLIPLLPISVTVEEMIEVFQS